MLSRKDVINAIKSGRKSQCLDGRDHARLAAFFPVSDYEIFGFMLKDGVNPPIPREWSEEEIKKQLKSDLAFAFEKALDQRGISSSFMFEVILMWMWVLEDKLQTCREYAMYGLPLYKKVAIKYGFPNKIGDDYGNEDKYNEDKYEDA